MLPFHKTAQAANRKMFYGKTVYHKSSRTRMVLTALCLSEFCLSGFCVLSGAPASYAASAIAGSYTLTDLGTLGGATSRAFSINNRGEVAGTALLPDEAQGRVHASTHAFLWKPSIPNGSQGTMVDLNVQSRKVTSIVKTVDGSKGMPLLELDTKQPLVFPPDPMHPLGLDRTHPPTASRALTNYSPFPQTFSSAANSQQVPSAISSIGYEVSEDGNVAGTVKSPSGKQHAALWRHGSMTDLGSLGGGQTSAYSLNSRGVVVGMSMVDDNYHHAFLWRNGKMHDLGTLVRDPDHPEQYAEDSTALAVNEHGQVAGFSYISDGHDGDYHACVWFSGRTLDLGTLGGRYSVARALNNVGQVVGQSLTGGTTGEKHAFLWNNKRIIDISPFASKFSDALALNDKGQVVGLAELPTGEYHAFLYNHGQAQDLNNAAVAAAGWELNEASAINNFGQIVGIGHIGGETHGFLLTPRKK